MPVQDDLELAIIGGGIGGVITLHCARRAGMRAVLLEREAEVGGLWRQLPDWQDIQIHPQDWTLGDLPIAGTTAPCIVDNIRSWVDRFGLASDIRLRTPVTRAWHDGRAWVLETPQGRFTARSLVCATGAHNRPRRPDVERVDVALDERHSSELRDAASVAGRDVLVVGGGASAFDLLDLCFAHRARRVQWVHRGVRWMMPTRKNKQEAGSIRPLARYQAQGFTAEQISQAIGEDLAGRYEKCGLQSIRPARAFDLRRDQLVPGRARMIEHFTRIERHAGDVRRIEGRTVTLSDGQALQADVLLWGTGYDTDLSFLDVEGLRSVRQLGELAARCTATGRVRNAPGLFHLGVGLDATGSAPWAYAVVARSIMAHLKGEADLGHEAAAGKLNHFDILSYLALRDPSHFPTGWRQSWRKLAMETPDTQPMPIP